ncbi:transposase [Microcoleus sp. Pol11C1]
MFTPSEFQAGCHHPSQKGWAGFVPVKARWGIERINSWMERCKSLVKNFEITLAHATTKINLCFVRLRVKKLVAPKLTLDPK